jgi:integrase
MSPQTLDLFDDTDPMTEARHFQAAFDAWLTHQRTSVARKLTLPSSIKAYTVLWQAFAEWCLGQSPVVALDTLTEADLNAFINSRLASASSSQPKLSRLKEAGKFTPRHAWRLLTLIDGVLEVRAGSAGSPVPNRCAADLLQSREDWLYANANRRATLPNYLEPAEARVLVNYLSVGLPRSGRRGADVSWQELRNRCAVALHLGSGLTPADVRELRLSSPRIRTGDEKGVPGTIHVPAHGDSPEREAPVVKWADYLLPATRTGKPWGKVTHYDAVRSILEASGIDKSLAEGGAYRLRHTFALRQLRRGKSEELVAKWLGIVEMRVMDRYRRVDYSAERPD